MADEPKAGDAPATPPAGTGDQQTPEQKAEAEKLAAEKLIGDKAVEAFKATLPKPPEKYELKLADGAALTTEDIAASEELSKELGLPNESGQKVLDHVNARVAARLEAIRKSEAPDGENWTKRVDGWEKDAIAHKDLGNGDQKKFEAVAAKAKGALTHFFGPEVAEFLQQTGFGSNPHVILGFAKIAAAMGEGGFVPTGDKTVAKSIAETLYPDQAKS